MIVIRPFLAALALAVILAGAARAAEGFVEGFDELPLMAGLVPEHGLVGLGRLVVQFVFLGPLPDFRKCGGGVGLLGGGQFLAEALVQLGGLGRRGLLEHAL